MTTNFKEFSAMVKELIVAANYITPEEETALFYFTTNLNLYYLKFSAQIDGFNTEVTLTRSPFGQKLINSKRINDIKVYADKVDGKLELNVIVDFTFCPDEIVPYKEQLSAFIQKKVDDFTVRKTCQKLKVASMIFQFEDNLLACKITFRSFE